MYTPPESGTLEARAGRGSVGNTYRVQARRELLKGAQQLHKLQLIELLLSPANGLHEDRGSRLDHDLHGAVLPGEQDAFRPAHRADTRMMIGRGKPEIELLAALGTPEPGGVRRRAGEPGWLCRIHG